MSNFIETIIDDNEHPRAALISTEELVRTGDGASETLGPPAVVVVTNARLLFITPGEGTALSEWSVRYDEIAGVTIDRTGANRVEVTTCEGVRWRCTLPNANPEVLDAVTRHLRWVDHVRTRLLDLETDIERAADEIRTYADEMNWDGAQETYQGARATLDELVTTVQLTTPMADETLAPELTEIERTLEEANVRLYIERAHAQLELGRYLIEHEKYDRAADVLSRARLLHRQAAGQRDAVERADAFAFGRQRELDEDLERLHWELQETAAEPVRQAQEATRRARETDDTATAVEHWETAVRRYDRILDLGWWQNAQEVTEEIDDARAERDRAAEQLIEAHTGIASERWQSGVHRREQGDTPGALDCFEDALAHLERARDLAVEFDHDDAADLEAELTDTQDTVETLSAGSTRGPDPTAADLSPGSAPPQGGETSDDGGGAADGEPTGDGDDTADDTDSQTSTAGGGAIDSSGDRLAIDPAGEGPEQATGEDTDPTGEDPGQATGEDTDPAGEDSEQGADSGAAIDSAGEGPEQATGRGERSTPPGDRTTGHRQRAEVVPETNGNPPVDRTLDE